MMIFENLEAPGFRPPKLLTHVDNKVKALYRYHEENQKIKRMTYGEFLKLQGKNNYFNKYRFIYSDGSFREFQKTIPQGNPYETIYKFALKKI
jgi:hypothetical protein